MGTRKVKIIKAPLRQAQGGGSNGAHNYFQGESPRDPSINQYGKERVDVNRTIKAVPREQANLEAEGGEQVIVPGGGGIPETYTVSGNRHPSGGVPLSLQPGAFVFSDHKKGMKISDPDILAEFGMQVSKKHSKGYTPADIAKKFDVNPFLKILFNPDSDDMARETAEMMIQKYVAQLGKLGLLQESMKGFPQGVPDISKPYLETVGMDPNQFMAEDGGQQQEQPQAPMMQFGGDYSNLSRFTGDMGVMQQGGPPQMAPQGPPQGPPQQGPPQQGPPQQEGAPQGGEDQMAQMVQMVTQALEQGANPKELVAQLLQGGVPPEAILQIFVQAGMPQQQAEEVVMSTTQEMEGSQGGQGAPGEQAQPSEEEMMAMQQQQEQMGAPQQPPMMERGGNVNAEMANRFKGLGIANKADGGGRFEKPKANASQKRRVRVSPPSMNRGGNISAFNEGYNDLQFSRDGGALDKFLPEYQDAGEIDDEYFDQWDANYIANAESAYEKELKKSKLTSEELPFKEWMQEVEGTSKAKRWRRRADKGKGPNQLKSVAQKAATTIKDATNSVLDARYDDRKSNDGSGKVTFDNPAVFRGTGYGTQTSGGFSGGTSSTPGKKPSVKTSTKSTKYQNVPEDKKAKSLGEATEGQYVQKDDGKWYKVKFGSGTSKYKGTDLEKTFGKGEKAQSVADRYQYLEDKFLNDEEGMNKLADYIREAANKEDHYKNTAGKTGAFYNKFSGKNSPIKDKSNKELAQSYLNQQKRNLALGAQGIDPNDFTQHGPMKADLDPETKARYKKMGITSNITEAFTHVGMSLENNSDASAIEQLGYWGYNDLIADRENLSPEFQEKFKGFGIGQIGAGDEIGSGSGTSQISPIDAWQTDTSAGQLSKSNVALFGDEADWEDRDEIIETEIPGTPGTPHVRQPATWWAQDVGNIGNLFGQHMGIKKYLPLDESVDLQDPDVVYHDPTRALAANAEQAAMAQQSIGAYGSPSSGTYRAGDIAGKAFENAANVLSTYEDKNVPIANQYMGAVTDVANKEAIGNAQARANLHKGWTIANQQYDNSKRQTGRNLFEGWRQGLTNKWQTDTLNQMYPQFAVNPAVGGRFGFTNGRPLIDQQRGQQSGIGNAYLANLDKLKNTYGDKFTEKEYEQAAKMMNSGAGYNGGYARQGSPYQGGDQFYNQYANQTGQYQKQQKPIR